MPLHAIGRHFQRQVTARPPATRHLDQTRLLLRPRYLDPLRTVGAQFDRNRAGRFSQVLRDPHSGRGSLVAPDSFPGHTARHNPHAPGPVVGYVAGQGLEPHTHFIHATRPGERGRHIRAVKYGMTFLPSLSGGRVIAASRGHEQGE